jgi:hypothetical protein
MLIVTIPTADLPNLYQDGVAVRINGLSTRLTYRKLASARVLCWDEEKGTQQRRIIDVGDVVDGEGVTCCQFLCVGGRLLRRVRGGEE